MQTLNIVQTLNIETLSIENIRGFSDFHLTLYPPAGAEEGQWILLLGDNGVGKTTILRSLVLALANQRVANALFQFFGPSAPFLRDQAEEGHVEVRLDGQTRRVDITRDPLGIEKISGSDDPDGALPVYAYGCQRGTALGGPNRGVEFKPVDDIRTLFDPTAHLIHAETWLGKLQSAAQEDQGGDDEAFFEAVRTTLVGSLNGVDTIEVKKGDVWLEGSKVGRVPLAALSDGYITTAGLILDLIARWSDRRHRLGMSLDSDFRKSMTGLVLIDEVDLHLHPLWQTHVVNDLRELFPRLSFVATTHNPLTVLGARKGELHVLRRTDEGHVIGVQSDIALGARADQVLTGEWFGLASTVDLETRGLLDRHRQMLREGVSREDPGRRELEATLRHRLGTFADTSLERLAQSIAAELMPDRFEDLSPEERQDLRKKILERVRERRGAT